MGSQKKMDVKLYKEALEWLCTNETELNTELNTKLNTDNAAL